MYRTGYCGAMTEADVGKRHTVCGWAAVKRDMGGVIFIELRDREGTLQTVFSAERLSESEFAAASEVRLQSVLRVSGKLFIRDPETYNPKLKTGTVELRAETLEVLSESDPLPFELEFTDNEKVREELRMKYRYLDLRRPSMLENLRFRHRTASAAREFLDGEGFIEVETPMLAKSTPEGAREFLVPSRQKAGRYYALPQSPQIFKQLLMVGGIDKYYQVARCFRDEDLRADRQPEFTQVDMELSFVEQEDVLIHLEKLFKYVFRRVMGCEIDYAFPRITWLDAMDRYGSDKPDTRFGLEINELTDIASKCSFTVFRRICDRGGVVRAINVPGGDSFTRSDIEELTDKAVSLGAGGMAWISLRPDGEINSILTKYLTKAEINAIIERCGAKNGDFILFCADKLDTVRRVLGAIRLELADTLKLRDESRYDFLFVTDFPQFEYSEEEKRWVATHHPFTMPYPEDVKYLKTEPGRVRAQAYDAVLNGIELGSGSVRIHDSALQTQMFEALGFSDEEVERRFGFMVGAFSYGTPPHAGFAFGLDRLVMQLLHAKSLRDVTAFPKNKEGVCLMTDAPGTVDDEQLRLLGITPSAAIAQTAISGESQQKSGKAETVPSPEVDIELLCTLSKLNLTDAEKVRAKEDMRSIIDFAGKLMAADTSDVTPTAFVLPMYNVFREDERTEPDATREELLSNAPTKSESGEFITVPRVVQSGD